MEMDQPALKEMGIKKIGDRVRIGSQAKLFRNREYSKSSRGTKNRVSILASVNGWDVSDLAGISCSPGHLILHPFGYLPSTIPFRPFRCQFSLRQTALATDYRCRSELRRKPAVWKTYVASQFPSH